jgi:Effector Associated Constant Component 1
MDLTVVISGPGAADEVRSLRGWLADDEELRGVARLDSAGAQPGTLGPAVETLAIALGPGGVSAALATSLVAWLRHRTSDVTISAPDSDGREVRLSATRVRGLDRGSCASSPPT